MSRRSTSRLARDRHRVVLDADDQIDGFPSAEPELADLLDAGYRSADHNVTPLCSDEEEPPKAAEVR
jgi:hypothetical protein